MSGATGRVPGPAGWTDATNSHPEGHATLLTVVPEPDGPFPGITSYWPQPPAGLVIHREQRRVRLDGREIELVFQEFELLEFLTAHPYRVFTRKQIIAGAWVGHRQVTGRTVDVHIHRLRRKLGPGYARYIVTVRRVGYTFRPPRPANL